MSPLVVIVGETASGKSALAHQLAKQFNGEIVCADSWTVYKGFDIGTAKPTAADQAEIQYHLVDVADAEDGFSAAIFKRLATKTINEIVARGKLPILVGGTGLYIDSVVFDYGFLPPSDPELRANLNRLTLEELLVQVKKAGLNTESIDVRNKRRVIRLIENKGQLPTKKKLRDNTIMLGLHIPRDELRDRITQRVDAMMSSGQEHEVRKLAEQYGWQAEPMKGIGYQQWQAYFSGTQSLEETRDKIIKANLDLAKRQRTWFKRNKSIQWLDNGDKTARAVDILTTFLQHS